MGPGLFALLRSFSFSFSTPSVQRLFGLGWVFCSGVGYSEGGGMVLAIALTLAMMILLVSTRMFFTLLLVAGSRWVVFFCFLLGWFMDYLVQFSFPLVIFLVE